MFKKASDADFEEGLKVIVELLGRGYAVEITKHSEIANALMKKFGSLCQLMGSDEKAEVRMMFVLSTIAELIK